MSDCINHSEGTHTIRFGRDGRVHCSSLFTYHLDLSGWYDSLDQAFDAINRRVEQAYNFRWELHRMGVMDGYHNMSPCEQAEIHRKIGHKLGWFEADHG